VTVKSCGASSAGSTRLAFALIAAFALARLALAAFLGPGFDEAYTIVLARRLDLSYFDHPPLHQWIAHFAALALGEGAPTRLPFIALFAATGWMMFVLTRRLFDARAALTALVALNLSFFFLASGGGWVVPDGPLLFALAGAALALAEIVFAAPTPRAVWTLWLAVGVMLGLAGLSKYSAALTGAGIVLFLALSPRQRHWFRHPAPYLAAFVALLIVTPVFVWNWRHGWVSFSFQGQRGAADEWRPEQVAAMIAGQFAILGPWFFVVLAAALGWAVARSRQDERHLFFICLALPPILVFTVVPLWGSRGLPHWPMPGWFFVFPLLGAWLGAAPLASRRSGIAVSLLTGVIAALVVSQATTGWMTRAFPLGPGIVDPTLEMLDWGPLRGAPALQGDVSFAVATRWAEAGKIGLALGSHVPVLTFSNDPRGMAFLDDSARYLGQDGVVIVPERRLAEAVEALRGYFVGLDPPEILSLRRGGVDAIVLAIVRAHGLTRPFPVPYRH